MIRVRVPGTLAYRNLALRVVAAAAKMIGNEECEPSPEVDDLEAQTVSAVGEAYNNIAIHAYADGAVGDVDICIESTADRVIVEMIDTGRSFDPASVAAPDLEELPESGMGLFIIRSFMDEMTYTAGPPRNVLRLVKFRKGKAPVDDAPLSAQAGREAAAVIVDGGDGGEGQDPR